MRMLNKGFLCLLLLVLVAACGRVSKPIPPEGSTYPETYVVTQDDD